MARKKVEVIPCLAVLGWTRSRTNIGIYTSGKGCVVTDDEPHNHSITQIGIAYTELSPYDERADLHYSNTMQASVMTLAA